LVNLVIARRTGDLVNYHDQIWFSKLDPAPVNEARIAALRFQQIALGARFPRFNLDLWAIRPSEWASDGSLIQPVDLNGIVGGGAAKPIAPFWVAHVGVGSRIDQNLLIARTDNNAQGVGMAVTRPPWPEWASIDDGLGVSRHHHSDPGVGKKP
jgi:hypothetical protein